MRAIFTGKNPSIVCRHDGGERDNEERARGRSNEKTVRE